MTATEGGGQVNPPPAACGGPTPEAAGPPLGGGIPTKLSGHHPKGD